MIEPRGFVMKNIEQTRAKWQETSVSVLIGILSAVVLSLIMLIVFSVLVLLKDMPAGALTPFAYISIAIGGIGGGFVVGRILRKKGVLFGAMVGFLYLLVLIICGMLFGHGQWNLSILFKFLTTILTGACGGIIGMTGRRKRH